MYGWLISIWSTPNYLDLDRFPRSRSVMYLYWQPWRDQLCYCMIGPYGSHVFEWIFSLSTSRNADDRRHSRIPHWAPESKLTLLAWKKLFNRLKAAFTSTNLKLSAKFLSLDLGRMQRKSSGISERVCFVISPPRLMGEYMTTGIHLSPARSLQHRSRTMSLSCTENATSKSSDSVDVLSNREWDIRSEMECRLYTLVDRRLFCGQKFNFFGDFKGAHSITVALLYKP